MAATLTVASASAQSGGALPARLKGLVAPTTSTPAANATRDVLQLNVSMFALCDAAARIFQTNIMANHPMILASLLAYRTQVKSAVDGLKDLPMQDCPTDAVDQPRRRLATQEGLEHDGHCRLEFLRAVAFPR
ncbi:MAG: hypothetical protein U1E60_30250 [Reyranellaceae bacterium]